MQACGLVAAHSLAFPSSGRYYSYATCGSHDTYTGTKPLNGKVLQVVVQAGSRGWEGSYHPSNRHYAPPSDSVDFEAWHGPLWDLVTAAASEANFTFVVTSPPEPALQVARQEQGTDDPGWRCTHAAGMGLVDMCVGLHTVTAARLRVTPFFKVLHTRIVLVVMDAEKAGPGQFMKPMESQLWYVRRLKFGCEDCAAQDRKGALPCQLTCATLLARLNLHNMCTRAGTWG